MQHEARRLHAKRWQAENQEGMAEVARFIETNGSFADEKATSQYTLAACRVKLVLHSFTY